MKKTTVLRRRAKEMRDLGETKLADHLEARADKLEGKGEPATVKIYTKDGRLFVHTPYAGHPSRLYALTQQMKEAGKLNGETTHNYEGSRKKDDPNRGLWSFADDEGILARITKVLGDFFSNGIVVNEAGEKTGELPESTYQAE